MGGKTNTSIIIFDDVKENLYELAAIVEELGYAAKPVITVKQARKALAMGDAALLLLDIAMPEMSGFEFLYRVRKENLIGEVPVIFISAYFDQDTKREAFEMGACDYIVRPFDRQECGYRIRRAAEQELLMRQLKGQREDSKQMLEFKMQEMEAAKRGVAEAMLSLAGSREPVEGYFERVRESCVHFAKGLSVIPDFEHEVSELFIEELKVAAPLYVLSESPWAFKEAMRLQKESRNEYLAMGGEIATYWGMSFQELNGAMPLSVQIVSLVVSYEMLSGGAKERMEAMKRQAEGRYHPLLLHAFEIIQLPYFLDKEVREGVSYR